MFKKSLAVKSNNTMRNSEIKKLLTKLPQSVSAQLGKQKAVAYVKALANNLPTNYYTFDKVPLFFGFDDNENVLYPSVYGCWMFPSSYPVLIVHRQVVTYLENGADLMLQGVVQNENIRLPEFGRDSPVVISCISGDTITGPIAVGRATMSSMDMISLKMKGKGVQILHIFQDCLWEAGPRTSPPSFQLSNTLSSLSFDDDFPALGAPSTENKEKEIVEENKELVEEKEKEEPEEAGVEETSGEDSMEDLLLRCFLAALKFRLTKSAVLPFDVGQFYSNCLLPCVPSHRRLDMKKTKYKKFSTFIKEINSTFGEIVKVTTKGKGNDAITAVTWDHPKIRFFEVSDERTTDEAKETKTVGPRVAEYLSVTSDVLPLMRMASSSVQKGDLYLPTDIRNIITNYVKAQKLDDGKQVKMDVLLTSLTKSTMPLDWNTTIQKIANLMTKTFVVQLPDGRKIQFKKNIPKITLKVENRMGNKKVTLIGNVEAFGIEMKELAHRAQVGVAASASIGEGKDPSQGQQVILQGSQIPFISALLVNDYGIDKKYIDGFDLGKKKK